MENKTVLNGVVQAAVEVNYSILCDIIKKPDLIKNTQLDENIFISESTKEIYKAIKRLYDLGERKYTKEQVYHEAIKNYPLISPEIVANCFDYTSDIPTILDDAIIQAKNSKIAVDASNRLKEATEKLESGQFDEESLSKIRSDLADAESRLYSASENKDINKVYTLIEWLNEYLIQTANRRVGRQFPYHNAVLDKLVVEGATPGDTLLLTSSTGMGKTTTVINLIDGFLNSNPPTPCILFSSEMSLVSMMDRLLAKKLEIPFKEIVSAKGEEYDSLRNKVEELKSSFGENKLFRFCENPCPNISFIEKAVKKFQEDTGQKYVIVFIDLLSMVEEFATNEKGLNFAQSITLAMNKLNAMNKRCGCHTIGTVQLNRSVESERVASWDEILKKTRPTRSSVKDANGYLERARTTVALWRPKAFAKLAHLNESEYEDKQDIVYFMILKSNNNDIAQDGMLFVPETFTLLPITDPETSESEE